MDRPVEALTQVLVNAAVIGQVKYRWPHTKPESPFVSVSSPDKFHAEQSPGIDNLLSELDSRQD
jgi:hypothetical protein